MKRILFSAHSLDIGGIETALVSLLNVLSKNDNYDITLVLEKKQGVFLNELDKRVKIVEYTPNNNKNILARKIFNFIKRIKFAYKYKNKFDFSACFATYSRMGSFVARIASKNAAIWVHSNYLIIYKNDKQEIKKFFKTVRIKKFKNIVFVSEDSKKAFLSVFPEKQFKMMVINNLINFEEIIKKSNEKIEMKREETTTFIHIGRHIEQSKKISRLINVAEKLKNDRLSFRIILIGDGYDTENYKKEVEKKKLNNYIIFCGEKKNPYPYFKISDCLILTSEFEGYPVVFREAMALNLPIITTDVSDAKIDIDKKFGIVVEKDEKSIYEKMKEFINNGFNIKEKINVLELNKNIEDKIKTLIG